MAKVELLDTNHAAEFLGLAPKTLRMWRWNHRYVLPYTKKRSGFVFYKLSDLVEFKENPTQFRPKPLPEKIRSLYRRIEVAPQ